MQVSSKTILAAISLSASSLVFATTCEDGIYQFECEDQSTSDVL